MTLDKQITDILETQGCDCLEGRGKAVAALKRLIKEAEEAGRIESYKEVINWLKISPVYAKDGDYKKVDKGIIIEMLKSSISESKELLK